MKFTIRSSLRSYTKSDCYVISQRNYLTERTMNITDRTTALEFFKTTLAYDFFASSEFDTDYYSPAGTAGSPLGSALLGTAKLRQLRVKSKECHSLHNKLVAQGLIKSDGESVPNLLHFCRRVRSLVINAHHAVLNTLQLCWCLPFDRMLSLVEAGRGRENVQQSGSSTGDSSAFLPSRHQSYIPRCRQSWCLSSTLMELRQDLATKQVTNYTYAFLQYTDASTSTQTKVFLLCYHEPLLPSLASVLYPFQDVS